MTCATSRVGPLLTLGKTGATRRSDPPLIGVGPTCSLTNTQGPEIKLSPDASTLRSDLPVRQAYRDTFSTCVAER